MLRLIVISSALGALFVLLSPASAKIPDPRFSLVDPMLLGSAGGTHAFRVTARDVTNAPLYWTPIRLDFSATTARLYSVEEPGATLDCASHTLTRWTGRDGVATFNIRFGGCTDGEGVQVSADGVLLSLIPARSTDMDALEGCGMGTSRCLHRSTSTGRRTGRMRISTTPGERSTWRTSRSSSRTWWTERAERIAHDRRPVMRPGADRSGALFIRPGADRSGLRASAPGRIEVTVRRPAGRC